MENISTFSLTLALLSSPFAVRRVQYSRWVLPLNSFQTEMRVGCLILLCFAARVVSDAVMHSSLLVIIELGNEFLGYRLICHISDLRQNTFLSPS